MAFVDPNTIHNPSTGTSPPATWGDQVRDNDVYLYERGPYICTSATRPGSPFEGQHIFETDTNKTLVYDGSSWWTTSIAGNGTTSHTSATMILQGGANPAHTTSVSEYRIICGVCEWWFKIDPTAAGVAGNPVQLLLPVNAAASGQRHVGAGMIFDSSASTIDPGSWELVSTSTSRIQLAVDAGTTNAWGATPSIAIDNGDSIRGHVRYLVASAA